MNRILIINLGFSLEFIEKSAIELSGEKLKDVDVIDFSGKSFSSDILDITSSRVLDTNNLIEKHSIRDFTCGIGKLSLKSFTYQNKGVRELVINDLPLYWLTRIAEKHPFNNWLYNFFFFKNFIEKKTEIFSPYNEIFVLLPYDYQLSIHNSILFEDLDKKSWENIKFRGEKKPTFSRIKFQARLFKFLFKSYCKKIRDFKYNPITSYSPQNIILNILGSKNSPIHDHILSSPSNPKVESLSLPSLSHNESLTSKYFQNNFPGLSKILSLIKSVNNVYNFCVKAYKKESKLELKAVIHEIIHALNDFNLLLTHSWLQNAFKNYKGEMQVFYEDEMYRSGRVISHAAISSNNKNITTFGYQHGNISESHTVYRFSSEEFSSLLGDWDTVPMPDYFLVWGEYFKKQFLETNEINSEKIVVAGNPSYFDIKDISEKHKDFKLKKILWCTTNIEFSLEELKIFSRWLILTGDTLELIIRMHPRLNIKEELQEELAKLSFKNISWDTNKHFIDTLKDVDLVICSAHSTIFIDATVHKKPVIRLFNNSIFNDELSGSRLQLQNARNCEEFELGIKRIMDFSDSIAHDFLYLRNDVWLNILNYRFNRAGNVG